VFALLFSVSSGCSRKVLSVFFDGVPNSSDSLHAIALIPINQTDSARIKENSTQLVISNRSVHPPYQLKKCNLCHDQNSIAKLLMPQPELCNLCHDDFNVFYAFVHGPAAAGYCTSCHNPHVSENKKLLLKTGQQLCLTCHNSTQVFKQKVHQEAKTNDCTECHNPHGSNKKYFLQ
jgi:predicted CXXCH cytochrome family protein